MARSTASTTSCSGSSNWSVSNASGSEVTSTKDASPLAKAAGARAKKQTKMAHAAQGTDRRKRLAANARERKRMHLLNKAYDQLRRRLVDADNKSKYDVLVQAKEYIQALAKICETHDKQQSDPRPEVTTDPSHERVAILSARPHQPPTDSRSNSNQHEGPRQLKQTDPLSERDATTTGRVKLGSPQSLRSHCEDDCRSPCSPCSSLPDSVKSPCLSTTAPRVTFQMPSSSISGISISNTHHSSHRLSATDTLLGDFGPKQIPENLSCSTILNSPPTSTSDSLVQLRPNYLPRIAQLKFDQQVSVANQLKLQLNRLTNADLYHKYAQAFQYTQRAT